MRSAAFANGAINFLILGCTQQCISNCRYPHTFPFCYTEPFKLRSRFSPKHQCIFINIFLLFLSQYFPLDSDLVSSSSNKDLGVGKNHKYLDIWGYITLGLHDTWIIMRFVRKLYPPSHLKARSLIFSFSQSPVEQPGRKVATC